MEPIHPTPAPCSPAQRFGAWVRRHVPLLLALVVFAALLTIPSGLERLTFWIHGAAPVSATQENLDGAQVMAGWQAGGFKQAGAIVSVLIAAVGYFCAGIVLVWFVLGYITPALPRWAKRNFKIGFDEENPTIHLSTQWQYAIYLTVWLSLLFFFALCLWAASNSQ